jgi:hypothetical protein
MSEISDYHYKKAVLMALEAILKEVSGMRQEDDIGGNKTANVLSTLSLLIRGEP